MLKVKEHKCLVLHWILSCVFVSVNLCTILNAKEKDFIYFDTEDVGQPDRQVPVIQPLKIVRLDPDYGGQWILAERTGTMMLPARFMTGMVIVKAKLFFVLRNYLKTDNRESLRYHNNAQASLIRPR